jgi:uncharacterized membrane-anchored protein
MSREIQVKDDFRDKLIKLIPAEIVAAYLALQAHLMQFGDAVIWSVIGILFLLTFFYLRRFGKVKNWWQLIFSSLSFLVWVYSIAPQAILGKLYNPQLATIVLVLWTLLIPFFFGRTKAKQTQASVSPSHS